MADMLPDDTNSKQLAQYQQTVRELQAVLAAKLDRATHEVLLRATDLQDAETFNLQRVFRSQDEQHTVALCLWGNLTPNTRYVPTLFSLSLSRVLHKVRGASIADVLAASSRTSSSRRT